MELNEKLFATAIVAGLMVLPALPMLWALTSKKPIDARYAARVRWASSLGLVSQLWLLIPTIVDRRFEDYFLGGYGSSTSMILLGGNALMQAVLAVVVCKPGIRGRWLLVAAHATSALYWGFIFLIQGAV